jgi:hypothetical protein
LAALLLPAGLAIGWLVSRRLDAVVLEAALIASGVCWLAGAFALLATHVGTRTGAPVHGLLFAILLRMGLPLVAGLALSQISPLADAGIFSMILGVYLCALVAETLLSLRMVQPALRRPATAAEQPGAASQSS